jgi:hypothetical protein
MKVFIPIIVSLFALSCADNNANSLSENDHKIGAYMSTRDLKMQMESKGFAFDDHFDLDTMERISAIQLPDITQLFFKEDTVMWASFTHNITVSRNHLEEHTKKLNAFLSNFDEVAHKFIIDTLLNHDPKKDLDIERMFNTRFYTLEYYPNLDQDIIMVNIYNKKQ